MVRKLLISLIGILVVSFGGFIANAIVGDPPALGLDLQGGISVTQEPVGKYTSAGIDLTVDRIRERIDSLGVAEPEIIRQGDAIVVNLPGVKDQDTALRLVQVTGQVYLRPVLQCQTVANPDLNSTTGTTTPSGATTTTAPGATTTTTGGSTTTTTGGSTTTTTGGSTTTTTSPSSGLLNRTVPPTTPVTTTTVPATTTTVTGSTTTTAPATTTTLPGGVTTTTAYVANPEGQEYLFVQHDDDAATVEICLVGPSGGTGEVFEDDATARILDNGWGVTVGLRSGSKGEGVWNALAYQCNHSQSTCPSGRLAIQLDDEIISAPVVQQDNFGDSVSITGQFKESKARDLARVLQSGSLPVTLKTQAVQNVSPTLGKDSLHAAVISGIVGVALVLLFMLLYYRLLGFVAIAGLMVSSAILWTTISVLSKTQGLALSLAGVAGIIVSVGVTIDSYVVFFERLKDEVRSGRTMRNSAQRGFTGAWHTILVADLVSLLGALVLWYLTVGSVRNFAFFLGLSTLCDLVVAYFFTRPAVLLLARTEWMARRKVMGIEAVRPGGAS